MQIAVQADIDRVDIIPLQHGGIIGIDIRNAELLRAALGGLLCAAAHGDDLRLRDLRIHIEMLLRDHPGPEQSDADGIHKQVPPCKCVYFR